MNSKNPYSLVSPEEAEKVLRKSKGPVDRNLLFFVTKLYFDSGDDYKALSLIVDFFEENKATSPFLQDRKTYIQFIEGLYSMMYSKKDIPRTMKVASILVDSYTRIDDDKILKICHELIELCGDPTSNSILYLILKEAISSAISIIENAFQDIPSEDILLLICDFIRRLPVCHNDSKFIIMISNRISNLYGTKSHSQLYILRMLMPEFERAFVNACNAFAQIEDNESEMIFQVLEQCRKMLFGVEKPGVVDDQPIFHLSRNEEKFSEYFSMIDERIKFRKDIMYAKSIDDWSNLSELTKRQERLVDYFITLSKSDCTSFEPELSMVIISLLTDWCDIDFAYAYRNMNPIIAKVEALENNFSFSTNGLSAMCSIFFCLIDFYKRLTDKNRLYRCLVQYLKYDNLYFKRICFEHDFSYFKNRIHEEYFFYNDVFSELMTLLDESNFPVNELYFELCRRKNIFYLRDMWVGKFKTVDEIRQILAVDFTFNDIHSSIPKNSILIDFMYFRRWFMDEEFDEKTDEYWKNAACIAFVVDSSGNVNIHNIKMSGNNFGIDSNDERIIEKLLNEISGVNRIVVCTDGDLNLVPFASLLFKNGFVTDYFAIRNIASIYDIIYPEKRHQLKNALLFDSPDYGITDSVDWDPLRGAKLEGDYVQNTLENSGVDVFRLSGMAATCSAVEKALNSEVYSIIHFSTHGDENNGNVFFVAAGANFPGTNSFFFDSDIGSCSLENTVIAIFSICHGAKQTIKLQDSLSGFIKASLLSGAASVLAPIGFVNDYSAVVFLNEFYKLFLNDERRNIEYSLQKAIKKIRNIDRQELTRDYADVMEEYKGNEEYPFADAIHWSSWVCYSREEMN